MRVENLASLAFATLLALASPLPIRAEEPSGSQENLPPLELTVPSKHTGQVSFGFGTHGAFSQMSGIYSFSPRLYARYGLGMSQGYGPYDLLGSSLTASRELDATQYFFSLGTPSLFHLGAGIDVGAEVFMARGPLFDNPWIASGFSRYGFDRYGFDSFEGESSAFLSPWQRRAWMRDSSLPEKSWFVQFHFAETTDQGTRGASVTVGK